MLSLNQFFILINLNMIRLQMVHHAVQSEKCTIDVDEVLRSTVAVDGSQLAHHRVFLS